MRKWFVLTCAVAWMLGVPTVVAAQPSPPVTASVSISALLAQFPSGGPGLRAAIAAAVEADSSLADAVVAAALKANPEQKRAMGAGLADAADYFAKIGLDWARSAEAAIRKAMLGADEDTRIGFLLGSAPTLGQGIPGFNNAGATTSGCRISPSGPSQPVPGC
jgi:hypothetical protein